MLLFMQKTEVRERRNSSWGMIHLRFAYQKRTGCHLAGNRFPPVDA